MFTCYSKATTGIPTFNTSLHQNVNNLSSLAAMDKPVSILQVEAAIGGTAQLPCKIINPQGRSYSDIIV